MFGALAAGETDLSPGKSTSPDKAGERREETGCGPECAAASVSNADAAD